MGIILEGSDEGLEYLNKALIMRREIYPTDNNLELVESLENLGNAYFIRGDQIKGAKYFEQANKMKQHLSQEYYLDPGTATHISAKELNFRELEETQSPQPKKSSLDYTALPKTGPRNHSVEGDKDVFYPIIGAKRSSIETGDHSFSPKLGVRKTVEGENDTPYPTVRSKRSSIETGDHSFSPKLGVRKAVDGENDTPYLTIRSRHSSLDGEGNTVFLKSGIHNSSLQYRNKVLLPKIERLNHSSESINVKTRESPKYNKITDEEFNLARNLLPIENNRTFIADNSIIIHEIKSILQPSFLQVEDLARRGEWTNKTLFVSHGGVKGYLKQDTLKKSLDPVAKEYNTEISTVIEIAQMLFFEAINRGSNASNKKDYTCTKEFIKKYPELIKQIISSHPEYFIDKSLVNGCIDNPGLRAQIISQLENIDIEGEGLAPHEQKSYWYKYTLEGVVKLLTLRLDSAGVKDVKIMVPKYFWDDSIDTAQKLISEITSLIDEKIILIPLNLYGIHWVGIIINPNSEEIRINYMDSEQQGMPRILEHQLVHLLIEKYPQRKIKLEIAVLEKQKFNNCAPEVIENFIEYIVGDRMEQEDTLLIHLALFEDSILYP